MHFNLRAARKHRHRTMQATAAKAGLNQSTVYRIEHRRVKPHKSTIRRLRRALSKR